MKLRLGTHSLIRQHAGQQPRQLMECVYEGELLSAVSCPGQDSGLGGKRKTVRANSRFVLLGDIVERAVCLAVTWSCSQLCKPSAPFL